MSVIAPDNEVLIAFTLPFVVAKPELKLLISVTAPVNVLLIPATSVIVFANVLLIVPT